MRSEKTKPKKKKDRKDRGMSVRIFNSKIRLQSVVCDMCHMIH